MCAGSPIALGIFEGAFEVSAPTAPLAEPEQCPHAELGQLRLEGSRHFSTRRGKHSSKGGKKRAQKVPTAMRLSRPQLHPTPSQGTGVVARRQACAAVAKRLENGPKTKQRNPIYHCTESFQPFLHFTTTKNHYKQKQQQTIYHCNESFQPFVHFCTLRPRKTYSGGAL